MIDKRSSLALLMDLRKAQVLMVVFIRHNEKYGKIAFIYHDKSREIDPLVWKVLGACLDLRQVGKAHRYQGTWRNWESSSNNLAVPNSQKKVGRVDLIEEKVICIIE